MEDSMTFVWEGTDDFRFIIETTNGTTGNSTVDYEIEYDYVSVTVVGRELQACLVVSPLHCPSRVLRGGAEVSCQRNCIQFKY
jgi:hypothetical protein